MTDKTVQEALDYHALPKPGKVELSITKSTETQHDLALAYSPGVGEPVKAIAENAELVNLYTSRANLVAVVTDGSAVLGYGNVGPLASKPVMEGKAVLFKRFADIDVFDLELDVNTSDEFVAAVKAIAPGFAGINLEDIAAPKCFEIEERLIEALDIPVFHDDQHGTAIIVAAGLFNALEIQDKKPEDVQIVCLGAGAAAIASMKLLETLGISKSQMTLIDRQGVVHSGRDDLPAHKQPYARKTHLRTLDQALEGADVFIGVAGSGSGQMDAKRLNSMADKPIVFALSNPDPEIRPDVAKSIRDDVIVATGRSDFPNQVNNVLCFPYIFRGALDAGAKKITAEMKSAAVAAIRSLAKTPPPGLHLTFGPEYIIPGPFDTRLAKQVSEAVKKAAK